MSVDHKLTINGSLQFANYISQTYPNRGLSHLMVISARAWGIATHRGGYARGEEKKGEEVEMH